LRLLVPNLVQAQVPLIGQSLTPFIHPQSRALGIAEVPTVALVLSFQAFSAFPRTGRSLNAHSKYHAEEELSGSMKA
jgi:hypothetical protein